MKNDQNVESPARNSNSIVSSYSSGPEVVEDNQFTNEQLLALSLPITTHVIPTDEDVPDDKVYKSKKDLMLELHLLAMKYDFEFRVKKSNKQTYTIVCFEFKWRLRGTKDIAEVFDDPQLRVRCTLNASPEEREEEYVRLFVSGPRREDTILDAYLHEDRADGASGDEEPDDIFKQAGQSSPAATPRAHLRRSRPCCEHGNMLSQILEQIKKLTDQVDNLKMKVDRLEEQRQRSP
ncbi:hypothetical protein Fot_39071 [Forsythia ovata]|uniref:Uncharacterized protein n=1 Tax=Forsythia ovata TaxID=205694 RepID=A0ABD1S568_9LAMI